MTAGPLLEVRGITKSFGSVHANRGIDLELDRGEILGLLGENGAGKSTLMNILYGLYQPDAGEIRMDGRLVRLSSPADAVALGIGMVHQHFMLMPAMTVAENIVLGDEPRHRLGLDYARAHRDVVALSKRFGLDVDPRARVADLSVGMQQRVEILRALYRRAELLILDEPTAVLTPQETDRLFGIVRSLAQDGLAVILITHKLRELLDLCDYVMVMRDGQIVDRLPTAKATREGLAQAMVGRPVRMRVERPVLVPGASLLEVHDLHVQVRGRERVRGVELTVRAGEIVGVAGVEGNGQVELAEAVAGTGPVSSGSVVLGRDDITGWSPRRRLAHGLAYVPEDRQHKGLVQDFRVYENAVLKRHRSSPFVQHALLRVQRMVGFARTLIERFTIRPSAPEVSISTFSGGNQQKLVLARELSGDPTVVVAAQPTRGVDVAATEAIHERLVAEREAGHAILLFSQDLDEVRALSDRIVVMFGGRIVGELSPGEATDQRLGLLMAGEALVT